MQTITNRGTFILVVTGLAACDKTFADAISQEKEAGGGRISQELINLRGILKTLAHAGTTRITRNKWHLIDHPVIGQISWKFRKDHLMAYERFYLRVNDKLVVEDSPHIDHKHTMVVGAMPYTTMPYETAQTIHQLLRRQDENKRWETVWTLRQQIVALCAKHNIELPITCYDPETETLSEINLHCHLKELQVKRSHKPEALKQVQQVLSKLWDILL